MKKKAIGRVKNIKKYPLSEHHFMQVSAKSGFLLSDLTMENIISDKVKMGDIQISSETLLDQADIAANAGREALANNFRRASEMASLPNNLIIEIYEKLRPGRSLDPLELEAVAENLRYEFNANYLADFVKEAASIYKEHGIFKKRY